MTKDLLIVAAGKGTRLKAAGDLKPLVELDGTPLIDRVLATAFGAGVERAVIVTGYNGELLERHLNSLSKRTGWPIETVRNDEYDQPNGHSVLKAKDLLKGRFFLSMCDHVVEQGVYDALLGHDLADGEVALACDFRLDNPTVDLDDVTKVRCNGDLIRDIGKTITNYNAFDCGVFRATPALFTAIEQAEAQDGEASISAGMLRLAKDSKAMAVDIGDNQWFDVDSPEMLRRAEAWLATRKK